MWNGLDRSPSESGVCTGGAVGLVCAGGLGGGWSWVGWVLVAAAGAAVHATPASKADQKAMVHLPSPQVAA